MSAGYSMENTILFSQNEETMQKALYYITSDIIQKADNFLKTCEPLKEDCADNESIGFVCLGVPDERQSLSGVQERQQMASDYKIRWMNRVTIDTLTQGHYKDIIDYGVKLSKDDNLKLKNLLTICMEHDFSQLFKYCLEQVQEKIIQESDVDVTLIQSNLIPRIDAIKQLLLDQDELARLETFHLCKEFFIWPKWFLLPFRRYFKKSQENITPPIIEFVKACYDTDKNSKDIKDEWTNKTENHVFLKNQSWACYATSNLFNDSSSILASFNDIMIIELTYFFLQK